ncbi:MAG: YceI family protein [Sphingobacteriales bacterium]|nr:YceI family protein [Sphingobacteriales bacterium]
MNKQNSFTIAFIFLLQVMFAQSEKYFTRNATVTFTSVAPVEKIISENKVSNCILNTQTGDLALKVVIKSFEFEKQAMADHFNNDYLNSDKFPNATFEGKITTPLDYKKNGKYNVTVDGKLTIHGVTKQVKQSGIIEVSAGKIIARSKFSILLSDYGVIVPNDYLKKISNTVDIDINAVMTPYVR